MLPWPSPELWGIVRINLPHSPSVRHYHPKVSPTLHHNYSLYIDNTTPCYRLTLVNYIRLIVPFID